MSGNLDKLKGHSNVKQDIDRRGHGEEINGKHSSRLNKRINDIKKVITEPDVWNVNIASRVEGFSPIGGIAISDKINKDISGVSKIKTSFIGFKKLKGVMQETKIYCINCEDLPVFSKQWLPYLTGLLLATIGAITTTITTVGFLVTQFTSINIFPDQGWGDFFKVLIRHLSIFIFGYSNLMYVSGVSSKTHRYFVYGSYFLIIIYLFAIISFSFKI